MNELYWGSQTRCDIAHGNEDAMARVAVPAPPTTQPAPTSTVQCVNGGKRH